MTSDIFHSGVIVACFMTPLGRFSDVANVLLIERKRRTRYKHQNRNSRWISIMFDNLHLNNGNIYKVVNFYHPPQGQNDKQKKPEDRKRKES